MKNIFILISLFILHRSAAAKTTNYLNTTPVKYDKTSLLNLYKKLELKNTGLREIVFENAIQGFLKRNSVKLFKRTDVITIIDFTIPSSKNRMFVIDLLHQKLLHCTLVAHGKGSGYILPTKFSNIPGSLQSSPGFYATKETYEGKNGLSLILKGLDYGVNHLAESRAIVLHGANYVSEKFVNKNGYLGRSWGCPAVSREELPTIIKDIKGGSCMYMYAGK